MFKKTQNTAVQSLERLGFDQQERMDNFLALETHQSLLAKFEVVFPQTAARPKLKSIAPNPAIDEVDFMSAPDDKELDLTSGDELSLSDDGSESPTLPVDEGLDLSDDGLSLSEDLTGGPAELDALAGMDDLSDPPPLDGTMVGLRLGEDLNDLAPEVQAKMREIDAIMEVDATQSRENPLMNESNDGDELFADAGEDDNLFSTPDAEAESSLSLEKSLVHNPGLDLGFDPIEEEEVAIPKPVAKKLTPMPTPPKVAMVDEFAEMPPMAEAEIAFEAQSEPEIKAAPVAAPAAASARPAGQEEYREVVGHYNAELERLQATLNHLRADRESLMKKLDTHEEEKIHHQRQMLNVRAELDEKKIEIQLMKKRMSDDTQDLRYSFQLEQERRQIAEEKLKAQQEEMAALQQKIRLEVRKVSGHERELEQQLELLKSDAETQIRNRDMKILELKRRLDSMEFDVENMSALEKKAQENKQELEVKLDKAIRTLRAAIGVLEVEDPKVAGLEKLKKSLDV